ncbi:uncharacterized protein TRAVEDRAFT_54311 [Trametes versicolor FP-101664 SS1]|uniref:Tyrosine specific protein phosphatases domain-containing protein n=1 Tax=Trametes versicolor (strain FP-101664) TaxID=717944 RepID=R7SAA0_TRAVS|nr:uncharacterized protein TRAVEDRAFT_54311 [Trametes versicolor FP-101664 SS1]EIW51894.1 hypothetical protein TRAVEDRAFT_54311 [Trametes versicolor FP-101664 SS1]
MYLHCTGKDSTGLLASAILMLLGARDEKIVADYALTEVRMQPVMPTLTARFHNDTGFSENMTGLQSMSVSKPQTCKLSWR